MNKKYTNEDIQRWVGLETTADKHAEVIRLYQSGMSKKDIGEVIGYSKNTVDYVLRKNGFGCFTKMRKADKQRVLELHNQGLTQEAIAGEMGKSSSSVSRVLLENGIRTPRIHLTNAQKEIAISNEPTPVIAEKLGIPVEKLLQHRHKIRKDLGLATTRKKYTELDIDLLLSDTPLQTIAEKLGISYANVVYRRRKLREQGFTVSSNIPSFTSEQLELIKSDTPALEVAKKLGVTRNTVYKYRGRLRGETCLKDVGKMTLEEQIANVKPLW